MDPFYPKEDNKELFCPEVPYFNVVGTFIYLTNYTQPDIAFLVNLLVRYNSTPSKRHWSRIKHVP